MPCCNIINLTSKNAFALLFGCHYKPKKQRLTKNLDGSAHKKYIDAVGKKVK